MARAKLILDLAIVFGALIGIVDEQRDGLARRQALKCAASKFLPGQAPCAGSYIWTAQACGNRGQAGYDASLKGRPAGTPSTTQPMALPWDSPKGGEAEQDVQRC